MDGGGGSCFQGGRFVAASRRVLALGARARHYRIGFTHRILARTGARTLRTQRICTAGIATGDCGRRESVGEGLLGLEKSGWTSSALDQHVWSNGGERDRDRL